MHCLNTKMNPTPHDRPTGQYSSESSNSRMSSPYPQSPSSVSPGPAFFSSSSSSSSNVVSSSSRLHQSRDQHTKTYASSSSLILSGAQAAVHQNKNLMHSSTQVPDPILSFQQCSSLNSTSQPPVSSTSQGTTQNETENIGLTRKESRSFSFQLCEATHDCQNLTFSPEKKMTQGDVSKEEQSQRQGGNEISDRKEKRLQRNRESARLSRRRRKQYLEVLENRVNYLCEEMDKGRREHVLSTIGQIKKLRNDLLVELEQDVLPVKKEYDDMEDLNQLDRKIEKLVNGGVLSRSSTELMLAVTFGKQYLKSLVIPPFKKYVMWLTLQNELFFRGGRAASERLSAARIGDKLLSSGYKHVSPSNGMWPLFCHEIALSYDQEEKMRQLQREIVSNQETWLHRHTGTSTEHVIESSHAAICGVSEACEKRAKGMMDVLTPIQKAKFLAWVAKKRKQDAAAWNKMVTAHCEIGSQISGDDAMSVDSKRHDAANLYILNHRLKMIAGTYARTRQVLLSQEALKKFSRRPAFESLASVDEGKSGTKGTMTKVGSSGALKRCSSELSCDVMNGRGVLKKSTSGTSLGVASSITPDGAQATYSAHVLQILGNITNLIPSDILVTPTYKEHEDIRPLPIHSNTNIIEEKPREMLVHKPGNQALYAIDTSSQSQNQCQKFITVPLPEPAPVMTLQRNALFGSYLASAMEPIVMQPVQPVSYINNHLASREQNTYISTAVSAPNFSAYSKVPSPIQSAPKEEDFSTMDDVGLWNVSNQMADDSLFDLTEEDWAIGEGAFFE